MEHPSQHRRHADPETPMSTDVKDAVTPNATSLKILTALAAAPMATRVELAAAAHLGRSTVTKHLALLESTGQAHRAAGGQDGARKLPDRWTSLPDRWTSLPAVHEPPTDPIDADGHQTPTDPIPADGRRLRPGQLDALVLDHLQTTASPGPHAPAAVAKTLGRSSGAIANCLTRLTAAGRLEQVSDRPRRYAFPAAR
jgi:DNA-binding transcriptional ArsR family regulator